MRLAGGHRESSRASAGAPFSHLSPTKQRPTGVAGLDVVVEVSAADAAVDAAAGVVVVVAEV